MTQAQAEIVVAREAAFDNFASSYCQGDCRMRRLNHCLAGVGALLGMGALSSTQAYAAVPNDRQDPHSRKFTVAQAPNGRVAAAVGFGAVTRAKGVLTFAHPSTGQYCFQPIAAVKIASIVPIVSVDWSESTGNGLAAYYRSSGDGCDAGYISVVTYSFSGGSDPVLSDGVGFTIVVP